MTEKHAIAQTYLGISEDDLCQKWLQKLCGNEDQFESLYNIIQIYNKRWFSKFCLAENQNWTNMSEARTEPELNQNQGSVQVVLVLCAGSELNFGIPTQSIILRLRSVHHTFLLLGY